MKSLKDQLIDEGQRWDNVKNYAKGEMKDGTKRGVGGFAKKVVSRYFFGGIKDTYYLAGSMLMPDTFEKKIDKRNEKIDDQIRQHYLMSMAQEHTKDEKLKNFVDLLSASSVDENGKPLPTEKIAERMRDLTGKSPEDMMKSHGLDPKKLESDEIKKQGEKIEKELSKVKPEEMKKIAEAHIKKAAEDSKKIQEFKTVHDGLVKQLQDAIDAGDFDKADKLKRDLRKHREEAKGIVKSFSTTMARAEAAKRHLEKTKDDSAKPEEKEDEPEEKEYQVVHNGKETTLVGRKKKIGDGRTYFFKNDPNGPTVPEKKAKQMIKKSGVKENLNAYLLSSLRTPD